MTERPSIDPPEYICRCEEITRTELQLALGRGAHMINDIKRRTRAGMGICQGRYCLQHIAQIVAESQNSPLSAVTPMTSRPPVRHLTLEMLANLHPDE